MPSVPMKIRPNVRIWCILLPLLMLLPVGSARASSSAIARILPGHLPAGLDQEVMYIIHHFPGDGEAVIYAEVEHDPAYVEIMGVSSLLGAQVSHPSSTSTLIDYSARPIAHSTVDTLRMQLRTTSTLGRTSWAARIRTSVGEDTQVTEALPGDLRTTIFRPMGVRAELHPYVALPDDLPISFICVVINDDVLGRPITGASLRLPPEFVRAVADTGALEGDTFTVALSPVPPGARDTLRLDVDVTEIPAGAHPWSCTVLSDSLYTRKELSAVVLKAPSARISPHLIEPKSTTTFTYRTINRCPRDLGPLTLEIVVPPGLVNVSAQCEQGEIDRIIQSEEASAGRVFAKTALSFAEGDSLLVEITVDAVSAGMRPWRSYVHSEPIGQRTRTVALSPSDQKIRIIQGVSENVEVERRPRPPGYATDLDLVTEVLSNAVRAQLEDLPLSPGAPVTIQNTHIDSSAWVLSDILLDALKAQGYKVSVVPPDSVRSSTRARGKSHVLTFRIADLKLICRPRSTMRFFGKSLERAVHAEYLLQLNAPDRTTVWTLWGSAQGEDKIPRSYSGLLASPRAVKRALITPTGRLVEGIVALAIVGSIVFLVF